MIDRLLFWLLTNQRIPLVLRLRLAWLIWGW